MNGTAEQLTIEVSTLGIGATSDRFAQVAMDHGYAVVAVGPNRFRIARVYRPTWAIVSAALTTVLCGIGLLFLLVKNTETGDAVVVQERTGVKLRLNGSLRPQFVEAVRSAMSSWSAPTTVANEMRTDQPVSFAPVPTMMNPSLSSDAPHSQAVAATVPRKARPAKRIVELELVFDDGRLIPVAEGGVIGRDPSADPTMPWAALHAIPDPSLSKTHLSVGPLPNGMWILDHHSTNGTSVLSNGVSTPCNPGMRAEVPVGAHVVAGDLRMEVRSR